MSIAQRLRRARLERGMSLQDVEDASRAITERQGNREGAPDLTAAVRQLETLGHQPGLRREGVLGNSKLEGQNRLCDHPCHPVGGGSVSLEHPETTKTSGVFAFVHISIAGFGKPRPAGAVCGSLRWNEPSL